MTLVPLVAQALYTVATVPALVALYRAKHSDQVSLWTTAIVLTAHAMNVAYSVATGSAYAVPFVIACVNVASVGGLAIYYRVFPGGR